MEQQVRRGSSFLLVACGLLAGLLVANLADSEPTPLGLVTGPGTDAGESRAAMGQGETTPSGDTAPGDDLSAVAPGTPADTGSTSTGSGAAGAASPGGGSPSASPAGATSGAAAAAAGGGATDIGVTAKAVKIGFAAIDTGALKALGPSYDTGDAVGAWKAIVEEARADKRLPVHGRDIDAFVIGSPVDVTPNAAAVRRSECLKMVQDQKVFAVVSGNQIDVECVAREFRTPLITSLLPGRDSDPQRRPLVFSTQTTAEKGLRNTAAWLIESGVLKGKTLGLYYGEDSAGTVRPMLQQHFVAKLDAAGFKIAREVAYTSSDSGRESTHVLQFRTANVDLILDANGINLVSGPSFLNAAASSNYKPQYVEVGVNTGSTFEGVSDNYNTDQWEGTLALLDDARSLEFGPQGKAGLSPATQKCADTIKRRRNQTIDPVGSSAAWQLYNQSCDLLNMLIEALKLAGPNLTRTSFVDALTRVQQGPPNLGWWATGGFGREHNWARQIRVAKYSKNCRYEGQTRKACWKPEGGYRPFWTP